MLVSHTVSYMNILVALILSYAHGVINFTNSRRIKIDGRMFFRPFVRPPDNISIVSLCYTRQLISISSVVNTKPNKKITIESSTAKEN